MVFQDSDKSDDERRTKAVVKSRSNERNPPARRKVKVNDLDPMDPAAYSDIPRYGLRALFGLKRCVACKFSFYCVKYFQGQLVGWP